MKSSGIWIVSPIYILVACFLVACAKKGPGKPKIVRGPATLPVEEFVYHGDTWQIWATIPKGWVAKKAPDLVREYVMQGNRAISPAMEIWHSSWDVDISFDIYESTRNSFSKFEMRDFSFPKGREAFIATGDHDFYAKQYRFPYKTYHDAVGGQQALWEDFCLSGIDFYACGDELLVHPLSPFGLIIEVGFTDSGLKINDQQKVSKEEFENIRAEGKFFARCFPPDEILGEWRLDPGCYLFDRADPYPEWVREQARQIVKSMTWAKLNKPGGSNDAH